MKHKASFHRLIFIADFLLGGAVLWIAIWRSPNLHLDLRLFITSIALALLIYWQGQWSLSLLVRVGVAAFFFRCIVLYIVGTDSLRVVAMGDAAMGLAATGLAYSLWWVACRFIGYDDGPTASVLELEANAVGSDNFVLQNAAGMVPAKGAKKQLLGSDWMPLQFSLARLLMLFFTVASLLALASAGGPPLAIVVLAMGSSWFVAVGCVRLVRRRTLD